MPQLPERCGIVEFVAVNGNGAPGAAIGIELVDASLAESLAQVLDRVEDLLRDSVQSADPLVSQAARHLVDAGGKRFRPLLVALAGQFGDPMASEVVSAAAVVELTHLGTLYHDDVMD